MKAILFDSDGVLTLPKDYFSRVYAQSYGLDPEPFERFFKNEWKEYVTGKKDIKEHIASNPDLWQWSGSPSELLEYWHKIEDNRDEELISLIKDLKAEHQAYCYLATEQDLYRGRYMQEVMFKDLFDKCFITANIGFKKSDSRFFQYILEDLKSSFDKLDPADLIFFDDSQSKIDAAREIGISSHLYTGIETVKEVLVELDFV